MEVSDLARVKVLGRYQKILLLLMAVMMLALYGHLSHRYGALRFSL